MTSSPFSLERQSWVDLEWPELLSGIAGFTVSDQGRALALALEPCGSAEEVLLRQETVSELMTLFESGAELPVGAFGDGREMLARLGKGGVPSAAEFAALLGMLDIALELRRFAQAHAEGAPQVARIFAIDPILGDLQSTLRRAISSEGEVLDQASSELSAARARVRTLRRRVQSRISELIGRYREALQDGYFAEREGRYVLPVRADAPFRVEGFVFGTSQSGSTLYVEPKEMAQLGHELRMAEVEVEAEEARVLAGLTQEAAPLAEELGWASELCARADLLSAIVRFARASKSSVIPLAPRPKVDLQGVRHPLLVLAGEVVVENDLSVESGRGLVISGPNAGGKTVALKAIGLLALMQAAGLPLPVKPESEVGFFSLVLADIGDDQSLSQSLSTFSGQVERVREFLASSDQGVLVVLDELMGGTDPEEGAVLAMAILTEMTDRGAAVVVTTHYDALKDFALERESMDSAAVGFDFSRFEPTFRVEMGRPGASSALFVARRHGLPARVTERAEALLPEVAARMRRDRIEIEQLRADLERQTRELAAQVAQQQLLERRLEREIELAREARLRDLTRETDELRSAIREARAELRGLRGRIKASSGAEEIKEIERSLDQVASAVALGSDVDRTVRGIDAGGSPVDLVVGSKVRLKKLAGWGEVLEPPRKGQVRVLVGSLKLTVPLGEVEVSDRAGGGSPPKPPRRSRVTSSTFSSPGLTSAGSSAASEAVPLRCEELTLDLRGKRVDPALDELDGFIDGLLRRQESGGFVLHGHGTGAMKDAVRSHLGAHPCVSRCRAAEREEGGDALTVFWVVGV